MPISKSPPPIAGWGEAQIVSTARAVQADGIVGKVTRPSFEEIAGALRRQANDLVLAAHGAEEVGARLFVTKIDVDTRVKGLMAEAALVGEAYRIIANLSPLEQSIRALIVA